MAKRWVSRLLDLAARDRDAEDLADDRNLCAALVTAAGAVTVLAQVVHLPAAARIVPAVVAVLGAIGTVLLHVLAQRAAPIGGALLDERVVPRSDLSKPMKFVNRHDELARLDELLERTERGEGPLVAVLEGLPGVGKSAVGRYWASRVRERFTDGDLVADFSTRRRGAAVDVSGFLADFIRKLGPPDAVVPATLGERVERFRAMTFDRKLLVFLDDVSEAAHVSQLRPTGKKSLVIATSYRSIEELYYDGGEFVPVDPLSSDRAKELLVKTAGEVGSAFEEAPEATQKLIRFCGGLPLPLCVCATRLMLGRGRRTVAGVVAEVADEQRRLDYLSGKGEYAGAAVFGFAYADLSLEERLAYRRAGLHPGLDVAPVHVAVLANVAESAAAEQLAALADTHLLEPLADGRYRFHDLVRLHARESAEQEDAEMVREQRLSQLVDWYGACLRAADRALIAERLRLAPEQPIPASHLPVLSEREAVFEWLEAERANILAILQSARDREWDDRVWQMVEALWLFYYNRRHYADWIDATEMGVECARRAGHRDAEARMRTQLAWAFVELGRYDRAHAELDRASRSVRTSDNARLKGSVREFIGACYLKEGDYDRALEALVEARDIFALTGSSRGVALQNYFIGWALIGRGDFDEALEILRSALEAMRRHDDQMSVGRLLLRIGQATLRIGDIEQAEAALDEGLTVFVRLGMRVEEAETYEELAAVADTRADRKAARMQRERAQAIYRALGHPRAEGQVDVRLVSAMDPLTF